MLRNRIGFCLLALGAAVLAACSTGGGGGSIVPGGFQAFPPSMMASFSSDARHRRRHPVRASVYLRIPAPHRHRRRRIHPQYISQGTASISFAVTPIAGSGSQPTPMPLQTMNVATPPCKTVYGSSAAVLCRFTVNVMPGRDSFVVKTYAGSNASGKVLSEYSSGPTIVPTPDPQGTLAPLSFTLEGVIDHVVLQFPSIVVPADTQGQVGAIPVGVATSAPLNVTPYDAANFQILSQVAASGTPVPYAAPVTLSVTPAGKGMTLSNDAGSGNSVTISNPDDLYVNVNYSGAFTASGGSVSSATAFSIAASGSTLALRARRIDLRAPRAATPAPNSAGIALSGNAIPGGVYTTTIGSPQPEALAAAPGTGAMAFLGYGYAGGSTYTSILGTANGGVPTLSGELANTYLSNVFPDSLGNVWAFDTQNYAIDCFLPSSSLTTPAGVIPSSTLYPGGSSYYNAGFAEDSSNNLWFMVTSYTGTGYAEIIGYVPLGATSCTSPSAAIYQSAVSADDIETLSIAAIPGTQTVAVGSYDYSLGSGSVLVAATSQPSFPPAPQVSSAPIAGQPEAMFGGASTVHATVNGAGLSLGTISAAGTYTSTVTYPADLASFLSSQTGTASSTSGLLAQSTSNSSYADGNALLLLNPADSNASTNLEVLPFANLCTGAAFDAQATAWTLCANPQGTLQFYRVIPTSTWSVLPGTVIPVTLSAYQLPITGTVYLGILQAFGTDSGPFTLSHYNSNVISGITQEGDRGLSLTITEQSAGPYVENADLVDKNGRSVPIEFEIGAYYSAGAAPRPGARARARRGYRPIPRN